MNRKIIQLLTDAIADNDLVNAALYRTSGYDTDKYCFIERDKYNQVLTLLEIPKTAGE